MNCCLQNVNGILFGLEKEGNAVTCYEMIKPRGHYTKSNKQATKKKYYLY